MGFLRKIGRKIGKGIRKLTKKIGPVGTFALYFMMPTIAHKFSNGLTTLSKLGNAADANILMKTAGKLADATHFVTDPDTLYYWEMQFESGTGSTTIANIGVSQSYVPTNDNLAQAGTWVYMATGDKYTEGSGSGYGSTFTTGDTIACALY